MKLEQQLMINREWSQNNNYWWTGNEVRAATIDQRIGSYNYNYWSTENEIRTTTIDQHGMKFEQQLLTNWELS